VAYFALGSWVHNEVHGLQEDKPGSLTSTDSLWILISTLTSWYQNDSVPEKTAIHVCSVIFLAGCHGFFNHCPAYESIPVLLPIIRAMGFSGLSVAMLTLRTSGLALLTASFLHGWIWNFGVAYWLATVLWRVALASYYLTWMAYLLSHNNLRH